MSRGIKLTGMNASVQKVTTTTGRIRSDASYYFMPNAVT